MNWSAYEWLAAPSGKVHAFAKHAFAKNDIRSLDRQRSECGTAKRVDCVEARYTNDERCKSCVRRT